MKYLDLFLFNFMDFNFLNFNNSITIEFSWAQVLIP